MDQLKEYHNTVLDYLELCNSPVFRLLKNKRIKSHQVTVDDSLFDARWVRNNVPPMPITHKHVDDLRSEFFNVIQRWHINSDEAYRHHPKAHSFWADWGYPVEARFLADCRHTGFWKANASYRSVVEIPRHAMPAPLQEIATICLAADINPDDFPCLPDELPQHNPMNDARHSARLLVKALAKLREQRQLATETLMRH